MNPNTDRLHANRRCFVAAICSVVLVSSCATGPTDASQDPPMLAERLDRIAPMLIEDGPIAGFGVAVLRQGQLVYEGSFGEQGPGVAVSRETVFNTASVAKTITAETMLALDKVGRVDLDEPIAPYVQHPDLRVDDRYGLLTPRLLLSHKAGLLNWAYAYDDGVLAFDHDPGERFSYSGAGMELVAQYASAKTGDPWLDLVDRYVIKPANLDDIALGHLPLWAEGRVTIPMNAEGSYSTIEELNPNLAAGDANAAADDLLVTVRSYAELIEVILDGDVLEGSMDDRTELLTSFRGDPVYGCDDTSIELCPDAYGHSIGWQLFRWGNHNVVTHSGSDQGENALVYFSPDTGNGGVIFVNGASGWPTMARVLEIIGDEPELAAYYIGLIETRMGLTMPTLKEVLQED